MSVCLSQFTTLQAGNDVLTTESLDTETLVCWAVSCDVTWHECLCCLQINYATARIMTKKLSQQPVVSVAGRHVSSSTCYCCPSHWSVWYLSLSDYDCPVCHFSLYL